MLYILAIVLSFALGYFVGSKNPAASVLTRLQSEKDAAVSAAKAEAAKVADAIKAKL